ncbi:MAG: metallophosphoesterase family protein [Candidatus Krumholzibacteria bacterium]|nr:metallophosphoesterase family protein [Candidatus Krumholzibacteria bacterium]
MRFIVFSDVHGNVEALERVLEEAERLRPDMIVSLGDVVGYGANPNECIALVQEAALIRIGGNHDVAAAGIIDTDTFNSTAQKAIRWTSREILPRHRDALTEYDTVRRWEDCIFAHASPCSPMDWEYVYTIAQANAIFEKVQERFIFIGHTHVPAIIEHCGARGSKVVSGTFQTVAPQSRYLVNVGSIGQPRDGIAAASFALLDAKKGTITIRRVPYDVRLAQEKIRNVGLPESLAERLATAR